MGWRDVKDSIVHGIYWNLLDKALRSISDSNSLKRTQTAFEQLYGSKFFDWLNKHPEKAKIYNKAMA